MPFFPQFSNLFVAPYIPPKPSLLLHMNGADQSTSFIDSSLNNYSLTASGNAVISTTEWIYGGASGYFDRSDSSKVSMSGDSNFAFSGDFTIELWVYLIQNDIGYQAFVSSNTGGSDATGFVFLLEQNNYIYFYGSDGEGSWNGSLSAEVTPAVETWTHLAVVRYNGTIKIYVDGIDETSSTGGDQGVSIAAGETIEIGHYSPLPSNSKTANCYIDDLRIFKDFAVYTSNFIPPTSQLPDP